MAVTCATAFDSAQRPCLRRADYRFGMSKLGTASYPNAIDPSGAMPDEPANVKVRRRPRQATANAHPLRLLAQMLHQQLRRHIQRMPVAVETQMQKTPRPRFVQRSRFNAGEVLLMTLEPRLRQH